MARLPLVVHERLGVWARHLRPRVAGWPVRLVESRSPGALVAAAGSSACPLVVFDLANRPLATLGDLDALMQAAPGALVLVLAPSLVPELVTLVREMGAAHVLPSAPPPPPPALVAVLERWLPLALRRADAEGWAAGQEQPEAETWPVLGLAPAATALGTAAAEPVSSAKGPGPA